MSEDGFRRLDLWLWYARFARTRSIAARLCAEGAVLVNGGVGGKAHKLRIGDRLSVPRGRLRHELTVRGLGNRRGPVAEARLLYDEPRPPEPLAEPRAEWIPLLEDN
jgi:ribosome-associated heat shock protein Hsp15